MNEKTKLVVIYIFLALIIAFAVCNLYCLVKRLIRYSQPELPLNNTFELPVTFTCNRLNYYDVYHSVVNNNVSIELHDSSDFI